MKTLYNAITPRFAGAAVALAMTLLETGFLLSGFAA